MNIGLFLPLQDSFFASSSEVGNHSTFMLVNVWTSENSNEATLFQNPIILLDAARLDYTEVGKFCFSTFTKIFLLLT